MPKIYLNFRLPEERVDFEYALNGMSYSCVIDDLDNWLRSLFKYENKQNIKIEEVRKMIGDLKNKYGVE